MLDIDMLLTIFIYCMYAVEHYHYILLMRHIQTMTHSVEVTQKLLSLIFLKNFVKSTISLINQSVN